MVPREAAARDAAGVGEEEEEKEWGGSVSTLPCPLSRLADAMLV